MAVSVSAAVDMSTDSLQDDFVPDSLKTFLAEADAALNKVLSGDGELSSGNHSDNNFICSSEVSGGMSDPRSGNSAGDDPSILRDHHNKKKEPSNAPRNLKSKSSTSSSSSSSSKKRPSTSKTKSATKSTPRKTRSKVTSSSPSPSLSLISLTTPSPISKEFSNNDIDAITLEMMHTGSEETPSSVIDEKFDASKSICRPNPATLYNTTAEAREIALDDNPSVCPDHGDNCACHLIPRPPVFNLDSEMCKEVESPYDDSEEMEEQRDIDNEGGKEEAIAISQEETKEIKEDVVVMKETENVEVVVEMSTPEPEAEPEDAPAVVDNTEKEQEKGQDAPTSDEYEHDEIFENKNTQAREVEFFPMPQRLTTIPSGDTDISFEEENDNEADFTPKRVRLSVSNKHNDDDDEKENGGGKALNVKTSSEKRKVAIAASQKRIRRVAKQPKSTTSRSSSTTTGSKTRRRTTPTTSRTTRTTTRTTPEKNKVKSVQSRSITSRKSSRLTIATKGTKSSQLRSRAIAATSPKPKPPTPETAKLRSRPRSKRVSTVTTTTPTTAASVEPQSSKISKEGAQSAKAASLSRLHSMLEIIKEKKKKDPKDMKERAPATEQTHVKSPLPSKKAPTQPKAPKLRSQDKNGMRNYSNVGLRDTTVSEKVAKAEVPVSVVDWNKRELTVPKAPKLTLSRNGTRVYSSVGQHDKPVKKKSVLPPPEVNWKQRQLTIPQAPMFKSVARHGERVYSTVGPEDAEKRERERKEKVKDERLRNSNWKNKEPTKARAPRLVSEERLGERKYAAVGSREEEIELVVEEPVIDWKNRKLTEPKAPRLSISERHGDRTYATVGPREEKVIEKEQPKIDWKNRKLTEPKAPKLTSQARLGERKYAIAGSSSDRSDDVQIKPKPVIDWNNRTLTVPKAPRLSLTHRSLDAKHRKGYEPKAEKPKMFKARPIGKGVMNGSGNVGIKKKPKRSTTAAAPFALSSRVQKKEIPEEQQPEKEIKKTFKARPLPKFSSPSISPEKRARYRRQNTESKPFNLATIERAMSPREKKRQQDAKRHPAHLISPRKYSPTKPQPFHIGDRSMKRLMGADYVDPEEDPSSQPVAPVEEPLTQPESPPVITRDSDAGSPVFPSEEDLIRKCKTWSVTDTDPSTVTSATIERTISEDVAETAKVMKERSLIPSASVPKPAAPDAPKDETASAPVAGPSEPSAPQAPKETQTSSPKEPKTTTARKPFRLSATRRKMSAKEFEKPEKSFRARPMPKFKEPKKLSSRRTLTTPKPFRLSTRAAMEKRVEDEIDQKLALRSKQSATARGRQFEQTQNVVDKLEQLNSSLGSPQNKYHITESVSGSTINGENGPVALPQDPVVHV